MDDIPTSDIAGDSAPPSAGLLETLKSATTVSAPPLREEEVQNAVNFLTHPKVVASTTGAKRNFLKNKGLTDEEIDEGFKRVSKLPAPVPLPTLAVSAPPQAAPPSPPAPQFTWTRGLLTVSVLAAGAYGIGTLLSPLVRKWWFGDADEDPQKKVVSLLDAMSRKQHELETTISGVASTVQSLERSRLDPVAGSLPSDFVALRDEVRRLNTSVAHTSELSRDISEIKSLLQTSSIAVGRSGGSPEVTSRLMPRGVSAASPGSFNSAGFRDSIPAGAFRSYNAAVDERPAFAAPASEVSTPQDSAAGGSVLQTAASPALPHPPDYLSILRMLEQGQTPPGVRTDINDKPPIPNASPTPSEVPRRPKPWERQQAASRAGNSVQSAQGAPSPWAAASTTQDWHTASAVAATAPAVQDDVVNSEAAKATDGDGRVQPVDATPEDNSDQHLIGATRMEGLPEDADAAEPAPAALGRDENGQ